MFDSNIKAILAGTWPTIVIISVIAISMRIVYLIKSEQKIYLYKELLMYAFMVYIVCLFYVVTFQDVDWSTSNFIPFKEIFRYEFGSKMFLKNVLGNMIMFIPFGFFVAYFLKLEKLYSSIFLTLITSLTIELTQLMIGRVYDIDDIFLNLLGGIIGFGFYFLLCKIKEKLPSLLKNTIVYNIIMIILMILAGAYLINLVR